MTEQPFTYFTLVPQADRRQISERRNFWRGGRRATDAVAHQEALGEGAPADTVLWAASASSAPEKLRLH